MKTWLLQYSNSSFTFYVAPLGGSTMRKKLAEKYATREEAEKMRDSDAALKLFEPAEYEFDFETSPKEEINSST